MSSEKICFVIAPIGEPGTHVRKRSDQVLKYVVKPAAEECGFKALRADAISETGIITSQVIDHILEDAMVVADLTGHNANVFYELAIRHATRLPYVQLINEGETLPFDVAGIRTIPFNHQDLDSVEFAKGEIVKHMRAMTEKGSEVPSPITVAIDLSALSKSAKPEDRQLGEVLTAVAELKQQFNSIQHQMSYRASIPHNLYATYESAGLAGLDSNNVYNVLPPQVFSVDGAPYLHSLKTAAAYIQREPLKTIRQPSKRPETNSESNKED